MGEEIHKYFNIWCKIQLDLPVHFFVKTGGCVVATKLQSPSGAIHSSAPSALSLPEERNEMVLSVDCRAKSASYLSPRPHLFLQGSGILM